jgi:IrrE N-terminal-like domain
MGKDDAVTVFADGAITITAKQSCWDRANQKRGRPRQTLAHELGHAVQGHAEMRADKPMARRQGAAGKYISADNRPSATRSAEGLPASKSAEHQAKVFAPAFLINDRIAETLSSAKEIALAFGISVQSAEIYFEELTKRRNRQKSVERVRRRADETIAILSARKSVIVKYVSEVCPACGTRTVLPSDSKFKCDTCKKVFDLFQDGDAVDF